MPSNNCLITSYIIDNDDNTATPANLQAGLTFGSCATISPTVDCIRTVSYDTSKIEKFIFYIHVFGEDSKNSISPKIIRYIGCHSMSLSPKIPENLNLTQSYFVQQPGLF